MKIYLASRSLRRQELLRQIGVQFEIIDIDIDEHWDGQEQPRSYVERLALEKAQSARLKISPDQPFAIIGADTSVVLDDAVLGKAADEQQAMAMVRNLSGRMHLVYSAVAVLNNSKHMIKTSISRVCFKPLNDEEIAVYCRSGEPLGKAGGYAIQGHAAGFVTRLEGSYSGVMGLPLYETAELLNQIE